MIVDKLIYTNIQLHKQTYLKFIALLIVHVSSKYYFLGPVEFDLSDIWMRYHLVLKLIFQLDKF